MEKIFLKKFKQGSDGTLNINIYVYFELFDQQGLQFCSITSFIVELNKIKLVNEKCKYLN